MPTVKLPNGQKRTFPYNAVGKAQANAFMKMSGGKMKNNPNYGMEKKTEKKVVEKAAEPKAKKIIPQTIEVWDPTRGKMKTVPNPLYK